MRKVIVVEWMTLDGVVQAPGAPEEDTSGGFQHGGWHLPYFDDLARSWVVDGYATAGGFLLGRRTYQNLAGYWPNASEEEQVIAQPLNTKPKYVASRTPIESLEWHVIGSSELVRSLLAHDLVDEFRVMIDPLLLGGGKRIFPDDRALRRLRLLDSQVTTTGALLATFAIDRG